MVKTYINGILLPVNPMDDITIDAKNNNKRVEIISLGDVSMLGSRGLYSMTIKSLFTDNVYPWGATSSPRPATEYVNLLRQLQEAQQPVRVVIVGDGLDINMLWSIESLATTQRHGETNEYYYTLALAEYRQYTVTQIEVVPDALQRPKAKAVAVRQETKPDVRSWTVKKGDALSAIAQSCYNDGSQYNKIYQANKAMMDAYNNKHGMPKHTIYPNWVLTIP